MRGLNFLSEFFAKNVVRKCNNKKRAHNARCFYLKKNEMSEKVFAMLLSAFYTE